MNGLPSSALIRVFVLRSGGIIRHGDRFHVHAERTSRIVGHTTGPLNRALGIARVSTSPGPNLDPHGRLGVLICVSRLGSEGAYGDTINLPDDMVGCPVNCIGMEGIVVVWGRVGNTPVIGHGVSLSEIVGLHLVVIPAQELPVDLVQIIRLQHCAAYNPRSRSRLYNVLDMTKHDIKIRRDQRRVPLLSDGEHCSLAVVRWRSAGGPILRGALGKVISRGPSERWVRRTGTCQGIAGGVRLG